MTTTSTITKFSPQQIAFLDWIDKGEGSCVLEAVAGAGKTTTLLEGAKRLTAKGLKVAVMAYNKKIAEEIKDKTKGWPNLYVGTVHSFGFSALRYRFKNVKVDAYKVANICDEQGVLDPGVAEYKSVIVDLVSYAKQRALGVVARMENPAEWTDIIEHFDVFADLDKEQAKYVPTSEIIKFARKVLSISNTRTDIIDYDDMVYLPLVLRVPFFRNDVVMVDEAQDTNAARRALVRCIVKVGGRVIAVGDRHQAIYGFTGADADSLDLIKQDFNAIELPLTTSYRCPKAVVNYAKRWVSHIEAAATAPEGSVSSIPYEDIFTRNDLNGASAVLCRNTKPLVELAFSLIRKRIGCKVEGRDIGQGLIKLATKWKVKDTGKLVERLDAYLEAQKTKFLAKKQETRAQAVEDQVETIKVIIEDCNLQGKHSVECVVSSINAIFADDVKGVLTLSTIHKSKGREWKTVYWLDRVGTLPSPYARQEWQQIQEKNLCYVASTRSQGTLVEVTVPPKPKK